jgi:hypothetical protein
MKGQPGKFIGFFNLIEAMKKPACPVCQRILEDTRHAMDSFLYESVNDPGLRDQIRADRGLCHRHSWQLAKFGDALGGAILFRDVLESVLREMSSPRSGLSLSRRPRLLDVGRKACLFCRSERQSHDAVVTELVTHLDDPELIAAWEGPAALCLQHLSEACGGIHNDAVRMSLLVMHRAKYERVCQQMSSLIEKQSYDHQPRRLGRKRRPHGRERLKC